MNRRTIIKAIFGSPLAPLIPPVVETPKFKAVYEAAFDPVKYRGEIKWINVGMPRFDYVDGEWIKLPYFPKPQSTEQ